MAKGLTTEEKKELKAKAKQTAMEELGVSEEEMDKIQDMLKLAQMPIELKDGDVKMGKGEVDVRKLSDQNFRQMVWRLLILNNLYTKDISSSLIDIMKLIMLVLKRLGCEDIIKATDDLDKELLAKTRQKMN